MKSQIHPKYIAFILALSAGVSNAEDVKIKNAGPNINSKYHEAFSTISPDGLTLYVSSDRPSQYGGGEVGDFYLLSNYNIYVTHRKNRNAAWGKLKVLGPTINTASTDHSPYISEDGHFLYFMSDRPGGFGDGDLYRSYRENVDDDDGWGPAINLGPGVNGPFVESCPTLLQQNGKLHLFFIKISGQPTALPDFMTSEWDPQQGSFSAARLVNISTPHGDSHLEPLFGLIWGMEWPNGWGGSDLWSSRHDPDDLDYASGWSTPVNLGPAINTEYDEIMPSPTLDGGRLIFQSNRPGGKGGMDIYEARHRKFGRKQ